MDMNFDHALLQIGESWNYGRPRKRPVPRGIKSVTCCTQSHVTRVLQLLGMSTAGLTQPSIADITEEKVLQRLFADPLWGTEFFELAGMPRKMRHRRNVPLDTAPGNFQGDIDVLRCGPSLPEQAVAYQVKRIKFGIPALRPGGRPNKLHEFDKAAQQANLLARMGFWQVYLYIIVMVDAREQNAGKITYAGLSSKLRSLVYSTVSTGPLDQRVGLGILDFTQPMDYEPFVVGTHGLDLRRKSEPMTQSAELTEWVREIFAEKP